MHTSTILNAYLAFLLASMFYLQPVVAQPRTGTERTAAPGFPSSYSEDSTLPAIESFKYLAIRFQGTTQSAGVWSYSLAVSSVDPVQVRLNAGETLSRSVLKIFLYKFRSFGFIMTRVGLNSSAVEAPRLRVHFLGKQPRNLPELILASQLSRVHKPILYGR